jgi:DNA-binding FadR family transcriptional regulator
MAEHEQIVAAIAARDPDAAAYAMRRHILRSGERFRRIFDEVEGVGVMAAEA